MEKQEVPEQLIEFIHRYSTFCIFSHVEPDGDCIASSLALESCLLRSGKKVVLCNEGPFGRAEVKEFQDRFVGSADELETVLNEGEAYSCAGILIDCSSAERTGVFAQKISTLATATIDHHICEEPYGDVCFVNPSAPSVSLLVQQLIAALGLALTLEEAEYIFYAFATDTGFFQFLEGDQSTSFQLVADLSRAGVSPQSIVQKLKFPVSLKSRQYLGKLLERSQAHLGGSLLFTWSNFHEVQEHSMNDRDSVSLYEQLLRVEGTQVVLVLWETYKGKFAGNIRSKQAFDSSVIARHFGGGGHARAAGFTIEASREEILRKFKELIIKYS